jgi:hypothetical protein
MIDIMNWQECEREFVRKVEVDKPRIASITDKATKRLRRAHETKVNSDNVSFVVEDYYEVIKEFLVAYLLKNGLRSKNHQCPISYFYKMNPELEPETHLISQMSFFRNRLNYYGDEIPWSFIRKTGKDLKRLSRY